MLPLSNQRISADRMNVKNIAYICLVDKNSNNPVYPVGVFYRLGTDTADQQFQAVDVEERGDGCCC